MSKQKLVELKSPFEQWPGSIWIPEFFDAANLNAWWERFNEIEDEVELGTDERHHAFRTWDCRFCFIKKHTLQLGKSFDGQAYEVEPSGLKLPSIKIAEWFIEETEPYLSNELNLKNSPGPSTTTKSTTQQ